MGSNIFREGGRSNFFAGGGGSNFFRGGGGGGVQMRTAITITCDFFQ